MLDLACSRACELSLRLGGWTEVMCVSWAWKRDHVGARVTGCLCLQACHEDCMREGSSGQCTQQLRGPDLTAAQQALYGWMDGGQRVDAAMLRLQRMCRSPGRWLGCLP